MEIEADKLRAILRRYRIFGHWVTDPGDREVLIARVRMLEERLREIEGDAPSEQEV